MRARRRASTPRSNGCGRRQGGRRTTCWRSSATAEGRAVRIKICGIRSRAEAASAVAAGAAYVGLVRFPPSPRHLTLTDARWVAESVPAGVIRVALTVDASDAALEEL